MILACMNVREIKREVNRNQGLKSINKTIRCINQIIKKCPTVLKICVQFLLPTRGQKTSRSMPFRKKHSQPITFAGVSPALPQYLLLNQTNQAFKVVNPAACVCASAFNQFLSGSPQTKISIKCVRTQAQTHTHKINSRSKSLPPLPKTSNI